MQFYQSLELLIKVTNDFVTFPDTETLSLIYLPNQARWKVQSPNEDTKSPAEANSSKQLPFEANDLRQSPVEANNSTFKFKLRNKDEQIYHT